MPWSAIAAGIGAAASIYGARQQNEAGQEAASAQMAFQERMAETRYQRTMKDMKAAGLNPMLAYQQGGGPVPSGAMYDPVNEMAGVQPAINSAFANKQIQTMIAQTKAQTGLTRATAAGIRLDNKSKAVTGTIADEKLGIIERVIDAVKNAPAKFREYLGDALNDAADVPKDFDSSASKLYRNELRERKKREERKYRPGITPKFKGEY